MHLVLNRLRTWRWIIKEQRRIRRDVARAIVEKQSVRIILGAGQDRYSDWIHTNYPYFDILNSAHWNTLLKTESVDNFLTEHVLEHLDALQVGRVAGQIYKVLKNGGVWRIAVPDGNNPDPQYINRVRPGGIGSGAEDHKTLWTISQLEDLLTVYGFHPQGLEYFDQDGKGHVPRDYGFESRGLIKRSLPVRPEEGSLIIDAEKPSSPS